MLLFITPLSISLAALAFVGYYFRKHLHPKAENIDIEAFTGRLKRAAERYIYKIYSTVAVAALFFALFILVVPGLGFNTALAFITGLVWTLAAAYFSFIFLIKLNSRVADRSSRGLIDSFHALFGGGSILSVFVLAFAVLGISIYYVIFNPLQAVGLVGFALGTVVASVFVKLGVTLYMKGAPEAPKSESSSEEKRDPKVISALSAGNLARGLGKTLDVFETAVLTIIATLLISSFVVPGLTGALALPFLIITSGLIATAAAIKLASIGATTNITQNIILAVVGSAILAALFAFPLVMWALSGNTQYSVFSVWVSVVLGLLTSGLIMLFSYIGGTNRFNRYENSSLYIFLLAAGILAGYWAAGLYGMALYAAGLIAMAGIFIALNIFSYIPESVLKITEITELPEEQKNIIQKLGSIADNVSSGVILYMFYIFLFTSFLFLTVYSQQISAYETNFSIEVSSPETAAGILLAFVYIFVILSRFLFKKDNNLYKKFKDKLDYSGFSGAITSSVLKVISLPVLLLFVVPVLAAFFLKAEAFGGFIAGHIIAAAFLGVIYIFDIKNNNTYSDMALSIISATVKAMLPIAILVAIFLI